MRTHGTLIRWNDDRGFGFIKPAAGSTELLVHIPAFPHDGARPRAGELVSYEVESRKDGEPQATRIMRPGTVLSSRQARTTNRGRGQRGPMIRLGGAVLLAAVAAYVYFSQPRVMSPAPGQTAQTTQPAAHLPQPPQPLQSPQPVALLVPSTAPAQLFNCDGRTRCPQMKSCAEATYFLTHCPGTKMDGDRDGVPCEHQWCDASRGD